MDEMMMKVEVISKEVIKPSTPTPDHLAAFNLSFFDQVSPPIYASVILFYGDPRGMTNSTTDPIIDNMINMEKSNRLKRSLSETLTHFYPLAGRVNGEMMVECKDQGVEYIEARASRDISQYMKREVLHYLLPPIVADIHATPELNNQPQMVVQVTFFGCGGIAICVRILHKIADASSFATFIKSWANFGLGESNITPTFDAKVLYPSRDMLFPLSATESTKQKEEKIAARRFVFDGLKIAALRARYKDSSNERPPTRVEAVSAIIWESIMTTSSRDKQGMATHAVNLRTRMDPPLSHCSFGNLSLAVKITPSTKENGEYEDFVGAMRKSFSKINAKYARELQGDDGALRFQQSIKDLIDAYENMKTYTFTSWCRFPFYEADFGWGKPIWVSNSGETSMKVTCLMDTPNGDGIEAWVSLSEEDMVVFERNQVLQEFVTLVD